MSLLPLQSRLSRTILAFFFLLEGKDILPLYSHSLLLS